MKILNVDNQCMNLNDLPETLEDEIQYAVLDNSNVFHPDFFFEPLIFLESFNAPAVVLRVNGHELTVPSDWKVVIGDSATGNDLEILPVTSIYKRGFEAFIYNPLSSFRPDFGEIEMVNIYHDIRWYFPKMRPNQLLAIPLTNTEKPMCVYAGRDINKQNELINYPELM